MNQCSKVSLSSQWGHLEGRLKPIWHKISGNGRRWFCSRQKKKKWDFSGNSGVPDQSASERWTGGGPNQMVCRWDSKFSRRFRFPHEDISLASVEKGRSGHKADEIRRKVVKLPLLLIIKSTQRKIRHQWIESDRINILSHHGRTHLVTEAEDEIEGGLLLDVVVSEGAAVLKLLPGKDEALLVRRMPSLSWILTLTLSMVTALNLCV